MKKFELTTDTKMHFGRKLFRIKALVSFGNVKAGDMGYTPVFAYLEKMQILKIFMSGFTTILGAGTNSEWCLTACQKSVVNMKKNTRFTT